MRIIVQVRELVASNVTSMVESATSPVKMLRLLCKEIEESDIALHGELSRLVRRKERTAALAARLEVEIKEWTDKAKIAMDHGREDLARSALLAREDIKFRIQESNDEAANCAEQIADGQDALNQLKVKLEETKVRLAQELVKQTAGNAVQSAADHDSQTDHRLDRISNLERRVDHALSGRDDKEEAATAVDAKIAAMRRDSDIEAELEKLRAAGTAVSKAAKKRK